MAPAPSTPAAPCLLRFWKHWGDGQAELNGYRLKQPRYGAVREGTEVLIFVTEDFSDSLRVKADPGKHPASDVYPVMKLNAVRDFQTGIYHYDVMTSVFARVAAGWPLAKASFSSQEWCGLVYHHLTPRNGRVAACSTATSTGRRTGPTTWPCPRTVCSRTCCRSSCADGRARISSRAEEERALPSEPAVRAARSQTAGVGPRGDRAWRVGRAVVVPAGRFRVTTWTVAEAGGPTTTFQFEAAPPYRLVRRSSTSGEEAVLLGSTRLPYWKLNGPGGEKHLSAIGLAPARVVQ